MDCCFAPKRRQDHRQPPSATLSADIRSQWVRSLPCLRCRPTRSHPPEWTGCVVASLGPAALRARTTGCSHPPRVRRFIGDHRPVLSETLPELKTAAQVVFRHLELIRSARPCGRSGPPRHTDPWPYRRTDRGPPQSQRGVADLTKTRPHTGGAVQACARRRSSPASPAACSSGAEPPRHPPYEAQLSPHDRQPTDVVTTASIVNRPREPGPQFVDNVVARDQDIGAHPRPDQPRRALRRQHRMTWRPR